MTPAATPARVRRGLAWVGAASSLIGVLDIIAMLVMLNGWISKTELGIATEAAWLFPILDQATDLGLSGAIVQRDHSEPDVVSTIFWVNLAAALALFGVLALVAPPLAEAIWGHRVVGYLIVAYGTKLVWQNVYFIPEAMMKRELRFKELSVIRTLANSAEFAGKVGFAAAGFGVWAFVLGPLARVFVTGIGVQLCNAWRPRCVLRLGAARGHLGFGVRAAGSQMLFQFYTNIDYAIVSWFFGATALGAYRLAYDIVLEPVRIISGVVVTTAFPAFARLRHDRERLFAQLVSFTRFNLVTVLAYASVVAIAAPDVLGALFPDYTSSATVVRILCLVAVLRAVGFVIPPLLDGTGHPERTFRYQLVAAIILPVCFLAGAALLGDRLGYRAVAVAWASGYPIAFLVLLALGLATAHATWTAFARALASTLATLAFAALAGLAIHALVLPADLAPGLRLAATAVVVVVTLVAVLEMRGLGPRALVRALRDGS